MCLTYRRWIKTSWGQRMIFLCWGQCFEFLFSALTLLVGWQQGHPARKNLCHVWVTVDKWLAQVAQVLFWNNRRKKIAAASSDSNHPLTDCNSVGDPITVFHQSSDPHRLSSVFGENWKHSCTTLASSTSDFSAYCTVFHYPLTV